MSKEVQFYFNSILLHFTQLITGLELLREQGQIDLRYAFETKAYPQGICRIIYGGKTLIFDLADSSTIRDDIYNECDFYIKRMLLKKDIENRKKLISYGLNMIVFSESPDMQNLIYNKRYFKYGLRYHPLFSKLLKIKNSISTAHVKNFQIRPADNFKIIFRSRLWDPDNNASAWKKNERQKINRERIQINRVLKKEFGNSFQGGIEKDDLSTKLCPDLLLSPKEYHRKKYLRLLKNSSVGVVSPGLEGSIGYKFGEYVAHGLAILTSPVDQFMFKGDFREGENYLIFKDVPHLVEKIKLLKMDHLYRKKMQDNNIEYYQKWLEPSAKLKSIFREIDAK